jgi:betaine reductase
MPNAAVKSTVYCLNHTPELGLHYGTTPYLERHDKPDSPFLTNLPRLIQPYTDAVRYAPNLAYIGAITLDQLGTHPRPWHANLSSAPTRFGKYGEIMPEDEFLGLMDICDVFDLIWLETSFAASVREKLKAHPVLPADVLKRLKAGRELATIQDEITTNAALPFYFCGQVVGCCRRAHKDDESLSAHVLLENLASKAGGLLSLFHLLRNAGLRPDEVDFVIECSEEAAGDMNQRGGGNFAKAIAESAACVNASGLDVRAFCAAPVDALITGASFVASGARKNVVVLAGGALPKLFMNSRDHVKKELPALENCLGNFAVLLTPDDGTTPVIRLDALGKHSVGAGASPQAVTSALVWEPLQKAGLQFADVDKYAAELHIPEITLPAGAGDVPEANAKMIAALAVMKKQLDRADISNFVAKHGLIGFAHTQGHIPSGVPYLGHAVDAIASGTMKRAMIIGKGSLFLARLTNLSDGASFLVEASSGKPAGGLTRDEVNNVLLDALGDLAESLRKAN